MTKVELEKISDVDIHLFIEKGMRGGISYINKRYSKANNKYCPDYDDKNTENYIIYLDMNKLYGHAMSQYLPYRGFKWIKINNETIKRKLNKNGNSLHGYFLEVDLEYPEYLFDSLKDYSLLPEKAKIKEKLLSPYCLEIKNEHDINVGNVNELTTNLMIKKTCCSIEEFEMSFIKTINI